MDYLFRMKNLRKYINEILSENLNYQIDEELISEDYDSIRQIKDLANSVLLIASKDNLDYVKRQAKEGSIDFLYPINLLDVYQDEPRKYSALQEFLINSQIMVQFMRPSNSSVLGNYSSFNDLEYDKSRSRTINLFPSQKLFDDLLEKFQKNPESDYKEVYISMWYSFHSTLEHELQHAFDDFRSNSKIFRNKRSDKYTNKYSLPSGRESNPVDPKLATAKFDSYLKLQHEIWARFTQAVNETRFTTADFLKTEDGVDYVGYEIKPLERVIKDFQSHFQGWRIMSDEIKRKMIRRVSNYWHQEKEGIDAKNQNSINKERESLEKKSISEVRKLVRESIDNGMGAYKKWKKENVTYRGISSDTLDGTNGAGARFGDGLYTAPLSNKSMAKGYGTLYFVVNGRPKNPIVFKDANLAEIWLQKELIYKNHKNVRSFNAETSIKDELLKMGYDGLEIKGREIVNFTPKDVMYFSNENQLIMYYEDNIENNLIDEDNKLMEEYPASFNMEEFKALTSFKDRLNYCNNNLKRIASGSSRTVYKIDDTKVLKLAKNKKGLAQNETEIDLGSQSYYSNIIAQIFEYEENGLWVEMELAEKINIGKFRMITKFDISDIAKYLINFQDSNNGKGEKYHLQQPLLQRLHDDEFVQSLSDFVAGTDALAGDMGKLDSYGLVNRGGEQNIVLIDFGLNHQNFTALYRENTIQENNTNMWFNGGVLLIKGKPGSDGLFPLYAVNIIDLKELSRTKVDNTPGQSAKMAILNNNLNRLIIQDGQLKALKVDHKHFASLSRTLNFNGRQSHAVTLNNNKTPMHWETLKYTNFPQLFQHVSVDIINLPGIRWTL